MTPQSHDQTIAENLAAPSHTNPEGRCYHGYFWRRAIPSDHVCVTPETRARVHEENAQQSGVENSNAGSGGVVVNITAPPQPCVPPATIFDVKPCNPFTGKCTSQNNYICTMPAQGCPAGTQAAGTGGSVFGFLNSQFFCCPVGWSSGGGSNQCCPNNANGVNDGVNASTGLCAGTNVKPVSNPAMNCPAGSLAMLIDSDAVCITPETCPSGYAVSGNSCVVKCSEGKILLKDGSCCDPGQATSQGTCCPGNLSPQLDGFCGPERRSARPRPSVTPQSNNPHQCANGLVPRDAFRGDPVCVGGAVHEQTIADNVAAPSRVNPNGSCIAGYVWREANANDHVCVPPATREQTWADNR